MNEVIIALKLTDEVSYDPSLSYIGADRGALALADQGIQMCLAIGDFDSVSEEFKRIRAATDKVVRLNPIKDDSDSETAVVAALKMGFDKIHLLGAIGGRIDHTIVNIRLVLKYAGKITIESNNNVICALLPGEYKISRTESKYISFFCDDSAVITLEGFKYPLTDRRLTSKDLYTVSNELIADEGIVTVKEKPVIMVRCKD